MITDQYGGRKEQIEYFPFGTERAVGSQQGTIDFDPGFPDVFYTFTDQEVDDDLGLYNFKARLYDPLLGRFISPDSLVPNPDNPQSLNRYSYCRNNPLNYVDPSGHQEGPSDGPSDPGGGSWFATFWSDPFGTLLGLAGTIGSTIGSYFSAPDSPSFGSDGYNIMPPYDQIVSDDTALGFFDLLKGIFKGEGISSSLDKISRKAMSGYNTTGEGNLKAIKDAAKLAEKIASGHAYKHVETGEFPEIKGKEEFAVRIEEVLTNPTEEKQLSEGRVAYWHEASRTIVIYNPNDPDGGSAFKAHDKKSFNRLK